MHFGIESVKPCWFGVKWVFAKDILRYTNIKRIPNRINTMSIGVLIPMLVPLLIPRIDLYVLDQH
jgi:hypothetical protein